MYTMLYFIKHSSSHYYFVLLLLLYSIPPNLAFSSNIDRACILEIHFAIKVAHFWTEEAHFWMLASSESGFVFFTQKAHPYPPKIQLEPHRGPRLQYTTFLTVV